MNASERRIIEAAALLLELALTGGTTIPDSLTVECSSPASAAIRGLLEQATPKPAAPKAPPRRFVTGYGFLPGHADVARLVIDRENGHATPGSPQLAADLEADEVAPSRRKRLRWHCPDKWQRTTKAGNPFRA